MQKNLNKMSLPELRKLSRNIAREMESRSSQAKKLLLKEMKKLCEREGIDILELVGVEKPAQATAKVKRPAPASKAKRHLQPLYFNRVDPSKTWSGRGRKPLWVNTWLDNGGTLEDLRKAP